VPVVVNEFEVVAEPTPQPAPGASQTGQDAGPASAPDLEVLLSERRAREARVRAY